ncbi:hypothetical protein [Streptomyces atriruber]|uniref:hypothetical protein n=1 Tax=Streptomyces atriruber TaxID=545121 RepID=UPI0006E2BC1E|nr:hypothetical protein [Streptomyces atriruber]
MTDRFCGDEWCLGSGHTFMLGRVVYRCAREARRPEKPISRELKRMHAETAISDALPTHQAVIRFGPADGVPLNFQPPYEITVHGPAAFVARIVASAADAFEEDAQR